MNIFMLLITKKLYLCNLKQYSMKARNILILLVVVLWAGMSNSAHATAQIPDILVVGNDTLHLFCNPLEGYFDETHPRPDDMWGMGSTACWRGYQAYFEIRSDSLFLTAIRLGEKGDSTDFYPLARLFGDKATSGGVFAYWVNDTLSCIGGELLFYIHMGYASLFEFNIEYEVQKGMVKKRQVYDNRKSFIPYGGDYDGADMYSLFRTYVESQIDYSRLGPDDMDEEIEVVIQRVDGQGRIKKVVMEGASPRQEREIRRVLKKVPRFNVIYQRGKPIKDISWPLTVRIYANEEERARQTVTMGPDVGEWQKKEMSEGYDYVGNLQLVLLYYRDGYDLWKSFIVDTTAKARLYKEYYCQLYGDPMLYQNHYFLTLGDSALKYYYQYWDETDDHKELYSEIVQLEQELGKPHNPKIVETENPPFVYLVFPEEMDKAHKADTKYLSQRCKQVSYHLRGFGEGDLHEPLPPGIQEEWRFLLLRGSYVHEKSPVLVKVVSDGKEARIIWRVAKELEYNTYPGLEHFRHGIQSEGERLLTDAERKRIVELANEAGIDTLCLDNEYFTSPPAIYNLEHRTRESYQIVNDYNHPYYNKEINPLFWPFRALCKYLLELADPTLPFDSDDE
jgi:hypothetical protein